MKTDTIHFIKALERYPSLWRKEDKDFNNRDVRRILFETISNETGIPVDNCKKKLKCLKDRMRELCHRLPKTENGEPDFVDGESSVHWPYYKHMLFMADQFLAPRGYVSVLKSEHFLGDEDCGEIVRGYNVEEDDEDTIEGTFDEPIDHSINKEKDTSLENYENFIVDAKDQILVHHQQELLPTPQPSSSHPGTSSSSTSRSRGTKRKCKVDSAMLSGYDNNNVNKTKRDDIIVDNESNVHEGCSTNSTATSCDSSLQLQQNNDNNNSNGIPQSAVDSCDYYRLVNRNAEMWNAFAMDITNDLRLITDPLLQIETKARIRRIVEQAVHDQLTIGKPSSVVIQSGLGRSNAAGRVVRASSSNHNVCDRSGSLASSSTLFCDS